MLEYLQLADLRTLLGLNHWLAARPAWYQLALILTDRGEDLATMATLLLLWFWPQGGASPSIFTAYQPPGRRRFWRRLGRGDPFSRVTLPTGFRILTRLQSRAQCLLFGMAAMGGYVVARLLAMLLDRPRPFNTFLPVQGAEGAFEGLRTYGSFPSDHAVLLAALPAALFWWDRRLAAGWVALGLMLAVVRVAVGFHYPGDIVAGGLIGMVGSVAALTLYERNAAVRASADQAASAFDQANAPYCYFLYLALAAVGLEFAMHFRHVLEAVYQLRGEWVARWRS